MERNRKKEILWKGSGTYRLIIAGCEFISPHVGREYTYLRVRGEYSDKNTLTIVVPNKWFHLFRTEIYVKNPVLTHQTFEVWEDRVIVYVGPVQGWRTHGGYYLYIPRIIETPKVVDGEIIFLRGKAKSTTWTSGGTTVIKDGEIEFEKTWRSHSRSGRHREVFYFTVFKKLNYFRAEYRHGKVKEIREVICEKKPE